MEVVSFIKGMYLIKSNLTSDGTDLFAQAVLCATKVKLFSEPITYSLILNKKFVVLVKQRFVHINIYKNALKLLLHDILLLFFDNRRG